MTTPGDFRVSFDGLSAAAARIESANRAIETRLDQLEQKLAPLRSDWTGAASDAYADHKKRWSASMSTMNGLLDRLGHVVEQSGARYAETEQANLQRW